MVLRWSRCSPSEQSCVLLQAKGKQGMCCRPSWVGDLLQVKVGRARQVHQTAQQPRQHLVASQLPHSMEQRGFLLGRLPQGI